MSKNLRSLPKERQEELIKTLEQRFFKHMNRHEDLEWAKVREKLEANPEKLWILDEMEATGGEPDVVALDRDTNEFVFFDCAPESPKGRRSICYDPEALESRKEHKPANSAIGMAAELGIGILTESEYRQLQELGKFDMKTSSWIKTPEDIRKLGGAVFADFRYGKVFVYHNGAESYYGARGFRGSVRI